MITVYLFKYTVIFLYIRRISGVGGSTLIAGAFGAGDTEQAKNLSSLCFWSAAALGAVMTVLLYLFQTQLLRMLGTKPDMWQDSHTYLLILACGSVPMLISSSMGMLLRAEGAVKEGM